MSTLVAGTSPSLWKLRLRSSHRSIGCFFCDRTRSSLRSRETDLDKTQVQYGYSKLLHQHSKLSPWSAPHVSVHPSPWQVRLVGQRFRGSTVVVRPLVPCPPSSPKRSTRPHLPCQWLSLRGFPSELTIAVQPGNGGGRSMKVLTVVGVRLLSAMPYCRKLGSASTSNSWNWPPCSP